jgi:predicted RNase H-like HicB family nuclease
MAPRAYHVRHRDACRPLRPEVPVKFRIVIEPDEDGVFVASCPSRPGCHSQVRTRAEAMANVREAVEVHLESLREHGETIPPGIHEDVLEIPGRAVRPSSAVAKP